MTITQVIAIAKAKAANSPSWLRAIDRAAAGLQSGELVVTLLHDGALVTSSNGSYRVNGHCQCKAAQRGHSECYHRAAVRLVEMIESENPCVDTRVSPQPVATKAATRIVRSVESDRTGQRYTVVRIDGWCI